MDCVVVENISGVSLTRHPKKGESLYPVALGWKRASRLVTRYMRTFIGPNWPITIAGAFSEKNHFTPGEARTLIFAPSYQTLRDDDNIPSLDLSYPLGKGYQARLPSTRSFFQTSLAP